MKKRTLALVLVLCLLLGIAAPALAAAKKATKVTLNKSSITLTLGNTATLKATVYPMSATNKSVAWKSSNTKVATVDSKGKVTPHAAGTATITATTKDGSKKSASCKVTVNYAAVKSVKLNKTSWEIVGGKTYQLKATVSPATANQAVTWKSSNTKVVTVSSTGKLTVKGYGTAKITATTTSGKKTATCTVTVPKTKTLRKTYTIFENWPFFMKDNLAVVVDGKTGKIVGNDIYQSKWDAAFGVTFDKVSVKVLHECGDCVKFRTYWTVDIGVDLDKVQLKLPFSDVQSEYVMYKDGTLERTYIKYWR